MWLLEETCSFGDLRVGSQRQSCCVVFFLITIAHDSQEYCFLNSSCLTVLRIQLMVYVSYVPIC